MDGYLNRWFLDPVFRGWYPEDMVEHYERRYGPLDFVRSGDLDVISEPIDFLGINYYFPQRVRADPARQPLELSPVLPPPPTTAMGWEVDPDGLHELLLRVRRDYGDVPIYITENGAAFEDGPVVNGTLEDPRRVSYLASHLDALVAGGGRRGRRAALLRLVDARQLRVGARLLEALRARVRRLRDAAAGAQAQRALVPGLHREGAWLMASICFNEVSKVFPDGTAAVSSLDLEVADGGFTVLVGPSGSGKSTALRMVAGLEEATSGTIRIADRVVNDVAPRDRDIAMVFQSYALYPHMTVEDNLGFALKMRGDRDPGRVASVARRLGISEQLLRRPRQLSGGQRQRVALGRAIVRQPAAFLMDEPLSNLDAKLRVEMRAYIARLHQELGTTTLYVTHDQTEAMTMGDRVAVMRDGRLEQVDAPQVLYDRPANLFVAAFIGSPAMNLLRGRLSFEEGRVVAVLGASRLVLPDALASSVGGWVDEDVVIGIRPECLRAGGRDLELEVVLVEALGSDLLVHLRTDASRVTVSDAFDGEDDAGLESRLTARLPPDVPVAVGDRLSLGVDMSRLHVFDPSTGLALR